MKDLYDEILKLLDETSPLTMGSSASGFSERSVDRKMLWRPAGEVFPEYVNRKELGKLASADIVAGRLIVKVDHGGLKEVHLRRTMANTERDMTLTLNGNSYLQFSYLYKTGKKTRYYYFPTKVLPLKVSEIGAIEIENQYGLLFSSFLPLTRTSKGWKGAWRWHLGRLQMLLGSMFINKRLKPRIS